MWPARIVSNSCLCISDTVDTDFGQQVSCISKDSNSNDKLNRKLILKSRQSYSLDRMSPETKQEIVTMYLKLGHELMQRELFADAIDSFHHASYISPANDDCYFAMGTLYHQLSLFDKAEYYYIKCMIFQPQHFKANYNMAYLYHDINKYSMAAKHFTAAVQINPLDTDSHIGLALAHKMMGNIDEAIKCCNDCLQIDENCVLAHFNLGLIYEEMGNIQRAILAFQAVLEIDPNHRDSILQLALLYQEQAIHQSTSQHMNRCWLKAPQYYVRLSELGTDTKVELTITKIRDIISFYHTCDPDDYHL